MSCSVVVRVLLGALFTLPLTGQDGAQALATFAKVFSPAAKGKKPPKLEDRRQALAATAGLDSAKAAEALVDGWLVLDEELTEIDAKRVAVNVRLGELLKGQEASGQRTLPQPQHTELNELQQQSVDLRDDADDHRELQQDVGKRIEQLRQRDAALWLLQNVCGRKKYAVAVKVAAGKAVGDSAASVLAELAAAMARAREPEEQVVLLDALALAGPTARAHAALVISLLQSKSDAVAERAALALAKLAVPEGIEPTIALLARTSGQTQRRVAGALEVLTGQQFNLNVSSWQQWWAAEGATVLAGGVKLGAGTPSSRKENDQLYYFGIPQDQSDAILYVIDCSGSMKAPVQIKMDKPGTAADGKAPETTRMEACKTELVRALGLLQPDQKFAILWYNDLPHLWEPKMQLATKEATARAQTFVKTLQPAQSTNIHDSLQQGFHLAGRGSQDKHYGIQIDTIFLLTDGSPTRPDGKPDSTEKILTGVRGWNALKRITIHCIAIGKDLNEQFLRQLASENGGEFKQF